MSFVDNTGDEAVEGRLKQTGKGEIRKQDNKQRNNAEGSPAICHECNCDEPGSRYDPAEYRAAQYQFESRVRAAVDKVAERTNKEDARERHHGEHVSVYTRHSSWRRRGFSQETNSGHSDWDPDRDLRDRGQHLCQSQEPDSCRGKQTRHIVLLDRLEFKSSVSTLSKVQACGFV